MMSDMPNDAPTDEVTTGEALDILGFAHRSSVTRLVAEGKLTPSRRIGNIFLFHRADVEALRDERSARDATEAAS